MAEVEKLNAQTGFNDVLSVNILEFIQMINHQLMDVDVKSIDIQQPKIFHDLLFLGVNENNREYPLLKDLINSPANVKVKTETNFLLTEISENKIKFRELKNAYHKVYNSVFFESSLKDLIVQHLIDRVNEIIEIYIPANEDAFTKMQIIINKASILYSENNIEINQNLYRKLDDKDEAGLLNQLNDFIHILETSLSDLKESKKIYIHEQVQEYNDVYLKLFNLYLEVKIELSDHNINFGLATPQKPGILNFSSRQSEAFISFKSLVAKCENLSQHLSSFTNAGGIQLTSIDDLNNFLLSCEVIFNHWNFLTDEIIKKNLKRFNPFHSLKSFVLAIDEIQSCYSRINNMGIFQKEFNLNTQNLNIILDNLNRHIKEIKSFRHYLNEYSKQKEWLQFYDNLESDYKLQLQELMSFQPNNWLAIFKYNFKTNFIESRLHPSIIDFNLLQLKNPEQHLKAELAILKNSYVERLRHNLNSYLNGNGINLSKLKARLESEELGWEVLDRSICPVNLSPVNSDEQELTTLIVHFHSGSEKQIELYVEDKGLNVDISAVKEISKIPIADRYSIASNMASSLLLFNDEFKVYQTKNSNLISLLPEAINAKLVIQLNDFGIKEIRVQDNKKNLLIESLLIENKKSILLVSDELINGAMVEDYHDQKELISVFSKIGFEIRSLNTYELFINNWMVVDHLLKEIN